ncbi:hypothetical protein ACWDR9_19870, partial [Streptosporangium sandarakinum]
MESQAGNGPRRAAGAAPVWARAWRELIYALVTPLMAVIGLVCTVVVALSVVSAAGVVGLPLLALGVPAARGLGPTDARLETSDSALIFAASDGLRARPSARRSR